jgi:hypothetical protein
MDPILSEPPEGTKAASILILDSDFQYCERINYFLSYKVGGNLLK